MERERIAAREDEYRASLEAALRLGTRLLAAGESSLDTVERVVRMLEDDPLFNAGRGAVYTHDGTHELDAALMDGSNLRCGAVGAVRTVKNPISLARLVMEKTPHVFLIGSGAEAVARAEGLEMVEQDYFHTEERWRQLERAKQREELGQVSELLGTVGAVARDLGGDLAAGTSTGGLTNKRFGRVGDVPVIGAGTYADNRTCAVSGTGKGEEFIRHAVAYRICSLVELGGASLGQAVRDVIHGVLRPGDGGVIAIDGDGRLVLDFNSGGMFRGAADASGRFETAIW